MQTTNSYHNHVYRIPGMPTLVSVEEKFTRKPHVKALTATKVKIYATDNTPETNQSQYQSNNNNNNIIIIIIIIINFGAALQCCPSAWQFTGYRLHRLMIVPNFVFTFQFFKVPRDYMYRGSKNIDNTNANVYSAVIMARPMQEFTRFIRWMQIERQAAINPQTKPTDLGCESACRLPSSTPTVTIYYYYSTRRPILILLFHRK